MAISIEADNRGLIVHTPYSSQFVSELKRLVPQSDRQFDGQSKVWIITPQYAAVVQKLILSVYGEAVALPMFASFDSGKFHKLGIRVEYVGQCKQRKDGSVSAYGHDGTAWSVVLPENVLKSFFGDPDVSISVEGDKNTSQGKPATLYAALLIKPDAGFSEIKSAFKRLARQWHPDLNRDEDAADMFRHVKYAYDVLSEPIKRKRYDAGLALEASLNQSRKRDSFQDLLSQPYAFRSPLKCGLLTVDGERKLGRIVVSKIHKWDDLIENGKVMTSSWPFGAEKHVINWVTL